MEKPQGISEFEEILLIAIAVFTVLTWIIALMRLAAA